ncbi:MAG: hypothetical protein ACTHMT_02445 [Verrucomicrobiota bacterium]
MTAYAPEYLPIFVRHLPIVAQRRSRKTTTIPFVSIETSEVVTNHIASAMGIPPGS